MRNTKNYINQNPTFPLGTSVIYNENKLQFPGSKIDEGDKLTRVIMDLNTGRPQKIGEIKLAKKIGGKGEGTAYRCNIANKVCKIYHPNNITNFRLMKLLEMQRRKIQIRGVCWPEEILYYKRHSSAPRKRLFHAAKRAFQQCRTGFSAPPESTFRSE